MKNLFGRIYKSFRYYAKGKGKPLHLILKWFLLFNIVAILIEFLLFISTAFLIESGWAIFPILGGVSGLLGAVLGVIIVFIYPIFFIYALWKCAFNVKNEALGFAYGFFSIPFLIAQLFLSKYYVLVSLWMVIFIGQLFG